MSIGSWSRLNVSSVGSVVTTLISRGPVRNVMVRSSFRLICAGLVFIGLNNLVHSEVIIRQHVGANDPLTEGWSNGQSGSAVINDGGYDAWHIQDVGAFPRYDSGLTGAQSAAMATDGWKLTATLRDLLAPDDENDLGNFIEVSVAGVGQWSLGIGADASGNPTLTRANANGAVGPAIPLTGVSGSGYHTYVMLYEPGVSLTDVQIIVDGISQGMMAQAATNYGDRFNFGSTGDADVATWSTNWNLVRLVSDPVSIPEPSSITLFCIGFVAMLRRLPRRDTRLSCSK